MSVFVRIAVVLHEKQSALQSLLLRPFYVLLDGIPYNRDSFCRYSKGMILYTADCCCHKHSSLVHAHLHISVL